MPRRVVLTEAGVRSQVVTDAHHRAGYMLCGKRSKVWCSCGWKAALEGGYDSMQAVIQEHKQAAGR